jgi:pimeloyl-ACP methyl ester carboxylesterase
VNLFTPHFAAGIDFLASGAAPATAQQVYVLLHGIGSGAASWQNQLATTQENQSVSLLAWNAPGYGASVPLSEPNPTANDYANALWVWIEALGIRTPIIIVGHSLGALIAASATLQKPALVKRLVLLAPALGYGDEPAAAQEKVFNQRMSNLRELGVNGMAAARAPAMLSTNATISQLQIVQEVMSQLNPSGYEQAVRMLCTGRLIADLSKLQIANKEICVDVACGSADSVTPPQKCVLAANAANTQLIDLGDVGHVCALEGHSAVNHLLGIV